VFKIGIETVGIIPVPQMYYLVETWVAGVKEISLDLVMRSSSQPEIIAHGNKCIGK
jgi:hypothetical protein